MGFAQPVGEELSAGPQVVVDHVVVELRGGAGGLLVAQGGQGVQVGGGGEQGGGLLVGQPGAVAVVAGAPGEDLGVVGDQDARVVARRAPGRVRRKR
ncbi:hypothetical protein GCM10023238_02380 [Streptomyces heliomycini]